MVEIPERLTSLFSGTVEERNGRFVIEVPEDEIEVDAIEAGRTYRIGVLPHPSGEPAESTPDPDTAELAEIDREPGPPSPPVDEGEVRTVTIESIGDQGDGIAKVERGYVVIVPETEPGQEPTVEVERVKQNVAFASVVDAE
ncbi:TRAM domain-containing protein [Halomicroarcula sp. GCM10025709]|uniref:TRAM domain-containing protein n=1 Tax=Haloarcula TaxID=2237 RepID=UPI0024C44A20|nr:TRAM domain-containing protein [Halomicroarcula sp. YJ-61-S]